MRNLMPSSAEPMANNLVSTEAELLGCSGLLNGTGNTDKKGLPRQGLVRS